jgi:hypothetical protein
MTEFRCGIAHRECTWSCQSHCAHRSVDPAQFNMSVRARFARLSTLRLIRCVRQGVVFLRGSSRSRPSADRVSRRPHWMELQLASSGNQAALALTPTGLTEVQTVIRTPSRCSAGPNRPTPPIFRVRSKPSPRNISRECVIHCVSHQQVHAHSIPGRLSEQRHKSSLESDFTIQARLT